MNAVNLIGTGSGSFENPGLDAERAVRAVISGTVFNAPNLGCENFQSYSFDFHMSGADSYGLDAGTAINCTSDEVYCSTCFRQQFKLAAHKSEPFFTDIMTKYKLLNLVGPIF